MTTALAVAVAAATLGAQDKPMRQETTYTGCLTRSDKGAFTLTHAMAADMPMHDMGKGKMAKDTMGKDTMAKDSMAKDSMAGDAMAKKDAMGNGSMAKDTMAKSPMKNEMGGGSMAMTLDLSSKSVDLSKHVGHQVSIKGTDGDMMNGMHAFAVSSLKMVAASCSM
jgi:hypothetical protein